jgi:hypothetical protein
VGGQLVVPRHRQPELPSYATGKNADEFANLRNPRYFSWDDKRAGTEVGINLQLVLQMLILILNLLNEGKKNTASDTLSSPSLFNAGSLQSNTRSKALPSPRSRAAIKSARCPLGSGHCVTNKTKNDQVCALKGRSLPPFFGHGVAHLDPGVSQPAYRYASGLPILFRSKQKFYPKLSHRILRHMHKVLNKRNKKLIAQFACKLRDEHFEPNPKTITSDFAAYA